jgi:simple sugar transport system substrate-binding protein
MSKRRLIWLTGLVVLVAALGVAAGCGGDEEAAPPAEAPPAETEEAPPAEAPPAETGEEEPAPPAVTITKMGVVAPEKANDYGWNQQGVEGAQAAADSIGAELLVADGAGYEDVTPILQQLADDGAQFIIAQASGYNTAAPEFAAETGIPVVTYDKPDNTTPGLVADISTSSQQGAYLAGILAARMSQTGTIGIVESADDTNWHKQSGGFVAGARSVNPDIEVLITQIGQAEYADAAGGKRVTESVIAGGADVVFGMGDGSSFGMLQAVETATPPEGADKVWFIDVIGDKTEIDEQGVLLSSVLWDFTQIFEQALADISAGTFGNQGYDLNVSNGISLLQTQYIPDDVWAEIETAQAGIADGSIEIPLTPTLDDVNALIGG